jgi:NTE family protein
VLVLAGGGTLGEAWMMGVLAGLEDAGDLDMRECEAFVGTSAGAIVAARLAAGQAPRRPRTPATASAPGPSEPSLLARAAGRALQPLSGPALRLERLPGTLVRGGMLRAMAPGTRSLSDLERSLEEDGGRFDGRLRVVAVDRLSGARVVFGAPGAPPASVPRAVIASCAIPGYFRPVEIAGREYVDGGVWSSTNLDVAPCGRHTEVLCLNPIASTAFALGSPLAFARAALTSRQAVEVAALERRGARVRVIGPAPDPARPMARNLMDPAPREPVLAGGYAQGLALAG